MACKIYVETTVIVCASLGIKLGGKPLKHDKYDTAYNFLQYAEMAYDKKRDCFYITPSVVSEAYRVLEIALNNMLENKLPSLSKKDLVRRRQVAEKFIQFFYNCLDQMDVWISYLKQESFDSRKKDGIVVVLKDEFRKFDIDFRQEYGIEVENFHFNFRNRRLRKVAKAVRTVQHKEAYKEYKPNPGRADIEIMAEVAAINGGQEGEIYLVGEDGHFCAKKNRELLKNLCGINCRYSHEMLAGGFVRSLLFA